MSTSILRNIYRYPVKSMGGAALERTSVDAQGIPGDRCWAVRDEERGGIKGGKRFASLMGLTASLQEEPSADKRSPAVSITTPAGETITSSDPQRDAKLSAAVGAPVTLWPLLPAEQLEHYRRTPPEPGTDMEQSLREVFARTADEPLPDLSAFPAELMAYESPPGTYFDAYPLLIMSEQSLATMQQQASDSQIDVRRFRPNLVVDIDAGGFPEEQWIGQSLAIGTAILKVEIACPRCVMTTHGFADLPKDHRVMRHLVQQNDGNLGVYASVVRMGDIKVGDSVTPMT